MAEISGSAGEPAGSFVHHTERCYLQPTGWYPSVATSLHCVMRMMSSCLCEVLTRHKIRQDRHEIAVPSLSGRKRHHTAA